MFCKNCGKPIDETARFCENCGTEIERDIPDAQQAEQKPDVEAGNTSANAGQSGNIKLCPDGKYRWIYEFPMLKNMTVLFTVWKVLAIAGAFPALISLIASMSRGFLQALWGTVQVYVLVMGIFIVLSLIAYFILAATYHWKYIVLFEMDEHEVVHAQQPKQFKKAEAIGWLTAFTGAAAGNLTTAGSGLLMATKSSTTSVFKNVRTVRGLRRRNTIKVNQLLAKNQVYVDKADYDFVWEFITSHCPNAKIK